jgi:hypothetical protein
MFPTSGMAYLHRCSKQSLGRVKGKAIPITDLEGP